MRVYLQLLTLVFALFSLPSKAQEGMVQVQSQYDVPTTTDRLLAAIRAKGLKVIGRINHAQAAEDAGLKLRPTELVIFGNPKVGTPFMACSQSAGIDLPQKALIWEAEDGKVWLGYNKPAYILERHQLDGCGLSVEKVNKALVTLAKLATQPSPQ